MSRSIQAVLWDLDDTLLNTLPARMLSLAHAYEVTIGGSIDALALWRSHRGGTLEALGQRLLGVDYMRFVRAYREHYYASARQIPPFEGVPEVLAAFHHEGLPMAVVTSKISWGAVEELQNSGLLQYFAAVIGADDTEQNKPDPEPVFAALDRLMLEPGPRVILVGDSPADIFAASNAGCTSVAATWGTLDEELLLDTSPKAIVRAPVDVVELVRGLEDASGGS